MLYRLSKNRRSGHVTRVMLCLLFSAGTAGAQSATAPVYAGGELPSIVLATDHPLKNALELGLEAGGGYDDNVLFSTTSRQGDFEYVLRPRIAWDVSRSRLQVSLFESPGFILLQTYSAREQFLNYLSADVRYSLTSRLTLRLREGFLAAIHPDFLPGPQQFEFNVMDLPRAVTILPLGSTLSTLTTLSATWQLSARSSIDVSGAFYYLRVSNLNLNPGEAPTPLALSQTSAGRAAYSYRLTPHQTVGLMYVFQDIFTEGELASRTLGHSVFYFHTIEFAHGVSLQLFGGPEYVTAMNAGRLALGGSLIAVPPSTQSTLPAGGANFQWQGYRTGFGATFRRQLRDGGGLLPGSQGMDASLFLRRRVSRGWTFNATAHYSDSFLTEPSNVGFRTLMGGGDVAYALGENCRLHLEYLREQESFHGIPSSLLNSTRNRGLLSFEYFFHILTK